MAPRELDVGDDYLDDDGGGGGPGPQTMHAKRVAADSEQQRGEAVQARPRHESTIRFQSLIVVKRINGAFNLNLVFWSLRRYNEANTPPSGRSVRAPSASHSW